MAQKCDTYLLAGGRFHDIAFARLELLKLLAQRNEPYVQVGSDFSNVEQILASDFLVTYTCDAWPTLEQ